ncbi:MAG TPA: rhodanese-like domain-containing protein [Balneolaceae bacterium]|nr:rhodanese-like domain-containing protein [Balneolaceae bacterium]
MLSFFKQLLDPADSGVDFEQLVANGATVIDVRTQQEYHSGHLSKSINIPLQKLVNRLDSIDQEKPIILCCASGSRSSSAKRILQSNGFNEVYNGGGWATLQEKISD